jgi:hypothetical protein
MNAFKNDPRQTDVQLQQIANKIAAYQKELRTASEARKKFLIPTLAKLRAEQKRLRTIKVLSK